MTDQISLERRTLAVSEVARILGVSRSTAFVMAKSGQLPTIRVGRRVVVPIAPLNRLLGESGDAP